MNGNGRIDNYGDDAFHEAEIYANNRTTRVRSEVKSFRSEALASEITFFAFKASICVHGIVMFGPQNLLTAHCALLSPQG
jgi:hypothetical protein